MSKGHGHRFGNKFGTDERGCKSAPGSVSGARNVIVFGLICDGGHEFEGWFRSSRDFDDQTESRSLACPACHSTNIEKGIMAPNLNISGASTGISRPYGDASDLTAPGHPVPGHPEQGMEISEHADNGDTIAALEAEIADMRRQIKDELRDYVETNYDYVGSDFPEEARRRHDDKAETGVYGEATIEDMVALVDEGISVTPLPQDRKKLN